MKADLVLNLRDVGSMSPTVVGAKARGLGQMISLGLPVPHGFVIATQCHAEWRRLGCRLPRGIWSAIRDRVHEMEKETGREFGGEDAALLLAVRSGAAASMPGVMDTVLNVGIVPGLGDGREGNEDSRRWLDDTRKRFFHSYRELILGDASRIPDDAWEQLRAAIDAVYASADGPRIKAYADRHPSVTQAQVQTAIVVQDMVFGNRDALSGSGVAVSRDPLTGQKGLFGDWLARSQGGDIVSGSTTPHDLKELASTLPQIYARLGDVANILERTFSDFVEIEYTVEAGHLYLLQVRPGQPTRRAAERITAELAREGLIGTRATAGWTSSCRPRPLSPRSSSRIERKRLATGIPASSGVFSGVVTIDSMGALDLVERDVPFVLARPFTTPQDLPVILQSKAIVTEQGGRTSHAAVICRELDIPCVVGCGKGIVGLLNGRLVTVDGENGVVDEADSRSVDGFSGTAGKGPSRALGGSP